MLSAGDHAIITSALAIGLVLVKILERAADWAMKRLGGEKEHTKVTLAEEPSRLLRETHDASQDLAKIVGRTDNDGSPLVYTPRSMVTNQFEIAQALKDITKDQTRNTESLEQIGEKVSEILSSLKKG